MGGYRCCRLGFDFDPSAMREELDRAVAIGWTRHFVARNFTGDWSGIALRSVDGALGHAESKPGVAAAAYRDTEVLAGCGYLKRVLAQLECPLGSARLLQLTAGSVILEHTDLDLGYEDGVVRLHVPIQTHPDVEFFIEDERVHMGEGECWYIDASLRHRVANRSPLSRVHLVFDCELNDWLRAHFAQAGFVPRPRDALERRGVRRADCQQVIEQLRAMGQDTAERLAREIEQEQSRVAEPATSGLPRRSSSPGPASVPHTGPEPGWLPFDLVRQGPRLLVEWRFIGNARFTDPWLEDTVRKHGAGFNGGVQPRLTELEALDEAPADTLEPRGLLFHASRTGSTLITQLLSCSRRLCVLAEPPIVEALLEATPASSSADRAALHRRLQAVLAHLGRRRNEVEQGWVLKLESQHVLELPLFEQCFPQLPWIFLFRAPEEILRSQRRQRGRQMVPGMISATRLGMAPGALDSARLESYCALMIEKAFEAALSQLSSSRGRAVHYRQLPDYTWRELDARFGLALAEAEVAEMRERSRYDAKHPGQLFASGAEPEPSEPLPEMQRERLAVLYARLLERSR